MNFKQNCKLKSLLDGVQVDLWSPCGLHLESVGESKVQSNLTISKLFSVLDHRINDVTQLLCCLFAS